MTDFIVEKIKFVVPTELFEKNSFWVNSSPRPYECVWSSEPKAHVDLCNTLNNYDEPVLLIDSKVFLLHGQNISIDKSRIITIDATEENKSIETVLRVIEKLETLKFTKANTLVVVGGGITQDIGAFVGAIFKRGVPWIFLPTTLLSMCDSCIGGKTGINFQKNKNQLALFSAPRKVIINSNFLSTLQESEMYSGLGEIIKLYITGGDFFVDMFNFNKKITLNDNLRSNIWYSLLIKKSIIEYDEFELNIRRCLNYGHTVGHAIETLSEYKIPHGQAVVIGLLVANKLAHNRGYLSLDTVNKIQNKVSMLYNKDILTTIKVENIAMTLKSDKKAEGNDLTFIFISETGNTFFEKIPNDETLTQEIKNILIELG